MKFKERLKQTLKDNGITQVQLAELLNVKKGTICDWLHGRAFPTLEKFYKLCLILNESANYLLGLREI